VRLLPDTHALLWLLADDDRLSARAGELLDDPANEVLLSAVVVWEVAVKRSLGKLDAPEKFATVLLEVGARPLAITLEHAQAVEGLPWHHRDPFDRVLVAQASIEHAVLVSADPNMSAYGVQVDW
jgi:PIN domain nuclease of toxin-antitoxin system